MKLGRESAYAIEGLLVLAAKPFGTPMLLAELVAFASDPRAGLATMGSPGSRCALCGFPTYDFAPEPESLPDYIVAAIAADFPAWRPVRGLCGQCAELYRAREMSLSAARELPRAG